MSLGWWSWLAALRHAWSAMPPPPHSPQPPPQLKAFQVEQFLKGMEGTGPHLTSGIKGNWAGLYRWVGGALWGEGGDSTGG